MTSPDIRRAFALAAAGFVAACGGDETAEPPPILDGLVLDTLFEVGDQVGARGPSFGGIWDVEAAPDEVMWPYR